MKIQKKVLISSRLTHCEQGPLELEMNTANCEWPRVENLLQERFQLKSRNSAAWRSKDMQQPRTRSLFTLHQNTNSLRSHPSEFLRFSQSNPPTKSSLHGVGVSLHFHPPFQGQHLFVPARFCPPKASAPLPAAPRHPRGCATPEAPRCTSGAPVVHHTTWCPRWSS